MADREADRADRRRITGLGGFTVQMVAAGVWVGHMALPSHDRQRDLAHTGMLAERGGAVTE